MATGVMQTNTFLKKLGDVAETAASQTHFRSLRDGFSSSSPFLVLAGLTILINKVILMPETGWIAGVVNNNELLTTWQELGDKITNGSLDCYALLLTIMISYSLGKSREAESPIFCAAVSVGSLFTLMPLVSKFTPVNSEIPVEVSGMVPYSLLGTQGIFVAIFTAILATELFVTLSKNDKLKIKLTGQIPPAVAQSFNALTAIIITLVAAGMLSFGVQQLSGMEVYELINRGIQAPLVGITTSLPGFVVLCFFTNLFFSLGIHPSGIIDPVLEPPLLQAMVENQTAFAQTALNSAAPHIIVLPFRDLYGNIGGTGSTLALVIAIFLISRKTINRDLAKTAAPLGVYNINEPVIYGLPVMLNPVIMIPFIFGPLICYIIAYFATAADLVGRVVISVPWYTPPFVNGFIASGGDFRNTILQLALLVFMVILYMPFLKGYEVKMGKAGKGVGASLSETTSKPTDSRKNEDTLDEDNDFSDFSDFK